MSNTLLDDRKHAVSSVSNMTPADRMIMEMEEQNIKPTEMQARIGLPAVSNLSNWKRRGSIPKEWVAPVATALDVTLLWLMTGQDPKHAVDLADAPIVNATPVRTEDDAIKSTSNGSHQNASPAAHLLAETILQLSGAGALPDNIIDALNTIVKMNQTHGDLARLRNRLVHGQGSADIARRFMAESGVTDSADGAMVAQAVADLERRVGELPSHERQALIDEAEKQLKAGEAAGGREANGNHDKGK